MSNHSHQLPITPAQAIQTLSWKDSPLIPIAQVAKIFGVSVNTIRNWTRPSARQYQVDFPKPVMFGGRAQRWSTEAIIQYIRAKEEKTYGTA